MRWNSLWSYKEQINFLKKTEDGAQVSMTSLSAGSTNSSQSLCAYQHFEAGTSIIVASLQEENSSYSNSKPNTLKLS